MIPRPLPALVAVLPLLAVAATGCGADPEARAPVHGGTTSTEAARGERPYWRARDCQRVARTPDGVMRLCLSHKLSRREHGTFVLGGRDLAHSLRLRFPEPALTESGPVLIGHWAWAALSPDGSTLLAQWSAECEVPEAFLLPLDGGRPRLVTGEKSRAMSPNSTALGWTTDGRAIVFLAHGPACGGGVGEPGVYVYSESGAGERIVATRGEADSPVGRSRRPRTVESPQ
ncbi:MAG TPA: hypothetical protein VFW80_05105 [Gaiellaceae bacterium]|nr:hypothetical protein [Gaiellaceae bacterium]